MEPARTPEQLRNLIRDAVVEVLKQRQPVAVSAPAGTGLGSIIVLFTGSQEPPQDFITDLTALGKSGHELHVGFSHTFRQHFDASSVLSRLPASSKELDLSNEPEVTQALRPTTALLLPYVSENTAAKAALGIQDSGPSRLLTQALASGKPVFVSCDLPAHHAAFHALYPAAPPGRTRVHTDHLHALQQLGLTFVSGSVADAITRELAPHVNETPQRLARQRPSPKRQFITAEDVWEVMSRGQKELVHPRNAVVTDQAREYAEARNFVLRSE